MPKLVLLRHGESVWNKENKFTGWTDVDLSEKGMMEAIDAGKKLLKDKFTFDIAFTSYLKRSIHTLWIVLDEMDLCWLPVIKAWELNERHYGALQGLNKKETALKKGEEQVHLWRRSFDVCPPKLKLKDKRNPAKEQKYKHIPKSKLPLTECLKDTMKRALPYYKKHILKRLKKGEDVLVVAHGNSLRALLMHLDDISKKDISNVNIPCGIPRVYEFTKSMRLKKKYYLASKKEIKKLEKKVAEEGKAK